MPTRGSIITPRL